MKKIKNKGFSFNIVDTIILLLVLMVAAAGVYVFFLSDKINATETESTTVKYTVHVPVMKEEFKDLIKVGDEVVDNVKHGKLGVVTDIKYEIATINTTITDSSNVNSGAISKIPYPDDIPYYRAIITIECDKAEFVSGKCYVGGVYVAYTEAINLRTPNYVGLAYCLDLKVVKDGGVAK